MVDWHNPSPAEAAALQLAKYLAIPGLRDHEAAELICGVKDTFMYHQLSDHVTAYKGAELLKKLLDSGYTPHKGWWHMKTAWGEENLAENLMEVLRYALSLEIAKQDTVVAPAFAVIFHMLFGKNWRRMTMLTLYQPIIVQEALERITRSKPKANSLYKCIHPECDVMVDRSKKRSGACCKAHMNYVCTHPDCVEKAAKAGWKHYTHAFGTKIAAQHWEFRKQEE